MGKKEKEIKHSFKDAVALTSDVSTGYKEGLSALGVYSKKIVIPKDASLEGSLDIDSETIKLYPSENRWDYAIGCDGKVFYIEVHSANTSEVSTVIKKLKWLKSWLSSNAPELVKLTDYSISPFYWIQSNGFCIPKHFPQYKVAASNKILPIKEWDYSKIKRV